jgi:hypothetical protein
MLRHVISVCVIVLSVLAAAFAQAPDTSPGNPPAQSAPASNPPPEEAKRLFGIVPNFRTSPSLQNYKPLTPKEKFRIASQDAFDRGTVVLAGMFAAVGQATNANPTFGQGVAGYASYLGTSYADFVVGDYMTEAIFPTILHQDPRYFRMGKGRWRRLGYAAGQIFWTHADTGHGQFNYSEILGNSTAVAISNAYYPDNRTAADAVSRLGTQLGVDMMSNILKEFWPEIDRKLFHKHAPAPVSDQP